MKRSKLIKLINTRYPNLDARKSEYYDDTQGGIWFAGAECSFINYMPIIIDGECNGDLKALLQLNGWLTEFLDERTLLAFIK